MLEEIHKIIQDAEMVLVGLGEEFNDIASLKESTNYVEGKKALEENSLLWLLPEYQAVCRKELPQRMEIEKALHNLSELLQNKNYFVVSVAMCDVITEIPWKDGRLVMPCGGSRKKQCSAGCAETLQDITQNDIENMSICLSSVLKNDKANLKEPDLGRCPVCGKPLILNNIYSEYYNENGYLEQWQLYTKWLQGTLNRKVVILELGVGMQFPTVIRWPFEKIAFFNKKASFYRVNETLYQMSEELKDKGVSISKNSIDWLSGM